MIIILHWILSAAILALVAWLVPGISINDFGIALFAAMVLGLVNILIKPLLQLLTFPITFITLGLFSFVINALMLSLTAWIVPGFRIEGFLAALTGALLLSLLNYIVDLMENSSPNQTLHH